MHSTVDFSSKVDLLSRLKCMLPLFLSWINDINDYHSLIFHLRIFMSFKYCFAQQPHL